MHAVKKKRRILASVFSWLFILAGIGCTAYPLISSVMEQRAQKSVLSTYQSLLEQESEPDRIEAVLKEAREYNSTLFQSLNAYVGEADARFWSDENYFSQLNISANSAVMGSLQIPKISVDLPIYHGTSEEVLSHGAGHYKGSSLPVGGNNTRAVLTAHRGLPNAKLFTRLDEMEKGDLFFVRVGHEKLAYRIFDIQTILPEEAEKITIESGKDQISLVTCTPYGINTHRLVVTGGRIPYEEKEEIQESTKSSRSLRELFFLVLPFVLLSVAASWGVISWICRRKENRR